MKRFLLMISLVVCTFCAWADQYDQQYFSDASLIQLEKAGTLSKTLGKKVDDITSLQIKGDLSDKDMKYLAKLTNLKKLNLRYANVENTRYFPSLENLEVLFLPENSELPKEYFYNVTSNQKIKVLLLGSRYVGEGYFRFSTIEEIIFSSENLNFADRALKGTKELKKIIFANSIKNLVLPQDCFSDCQDLNTVVFDCPVTIKTLAFGNRVDNHISKVTFNEPANIERIGLSFADTILFNSLPTYLNENFSRFMKINIPLDQNWFEKFLMWGININPEVEEIYFSNPELDLRSLPSGLFEQMPKLKKLSFANTIKKLTIPYSVFSECTSLESVIFDCPVSISGGAFSGESMHKFIFNAPAYIENNAINHVDTVVFNALPSNLGRNFANYNTLITPEGQEWAEWFAAWGINIDPEKEEFVFSSPLQKIHSDVLEYFPKLKKVTFAGSLGNLTITSNSFVGWIAIDTIVFDCPVVLEGHAFDGSIKIGEIIFNKQVTIKDWAFYGDALTQYSEEAPIGKITFNAFAKIEPNGFYHTNIFEMIFNTMPAALPDNFSMCKNIQVPFMEGAIDEFISWGINSDYLIDPSANLVLDIVVNEPGNILKYLPIEKLNQITSLTIAGHLYETDVAIIKMCNNLQYLNLENATISESPESFEYRKNDMFHSSEPLPDCYIPSGAFKDMRLKTVILPRKVKAIYAGAFMGCKSLKKINLGVSLVSIGGGAFKYTQLEEITFPKTLKYIHDEAFEGVRNLKTFDLSLCTIDEFYTISGLNSNIGKLPDLEVFYMPKGITTCAVFFHEEDFGGDCPNLKDFYIGKDVKSIDRKISNIGLHFQSETAPEIGLFGKVSNCTIYVPKNGNITSYYAMFNGNGNKIIQE